MEELWKKYSYSNPRKITKEMKIATLGNHISRLERFASDNKYPEYKRTEIKKFLIELLEK